MNCKPTFPEPELDDIPPAIIARLYQSEAVNDTKVKAEIKTVAARITKAAKNGHKQALYILPPMKEVADKMVELLKEKGYKLLLNEAQTECLIQW